MALSFSRLALAAALLLAGTLGPLAALAQDGTAAAPQPSPALPLAPPADVASAPAAGRPSAAGPTASPAAPQAVAAPAGVATGSATLPHDLSPWTMFRNADIVVEAVMVGLALASVFTWTVWVAKGAVLMSATARMRRAVGVLARAEGLGEAGLAPHPAWRRARPAAAMVEAARDEVERSAALPADGVKERTAIALQRIEARAARAMTRGTGLVATIGSTAPFVGLFGTVWGIMNSFVGISQAHTSSLAVVAPGIAEALLATAIGLVAAIPAVVIYNGFARAIAGYRALLGDASAEVLRHLSRDLDRHGVGAPRAAARQAAE